MLVIVVGGNVELFLYVDLLILVVVCWLLCEFGLGMCEVVE